MERNMEITVRNVKTFEAGSEETLCFTATVYVDGVKAFTAKNDGHGGCNFYYPVDGKRALLNAAEKWAREQPEVTASLSEPPFSYSPDLDHFVDEAVSIYRMERIVKRDLAKRTVVRVGTTIRTWSCPPDHPELVKAVEAKYGRDFTILNNVPMADAVAAYRMFA